MYKSQRGFTIPFISSIIGFFVAMTGAVFPAFSHNTKQNDTPIGEGTTSTVTQANLSESASFNVGSSQATTTSTSKPKPRTPVKQIPMSPSVGQSTKQDVVSTSTLPIQTPTQANPYKASLAAIDAFLTNPTLPSLRDFCMKAKELPGRGTYESLDPTRTSVIQYTNTLYMDLPWCVFVLSEGGYDPKLGHYTWVMYDSSLLISLDSPNDSDAIRTNKIKLNEALQTLGQYGLIGYESSISGGADAGKDQRPQEVIDAIGPRLSRATSVYLLPGFTSSVISPVKELTYMRQRYTKYVPD